MEGLLPLVYKAIKKNRTRRQYECLSSGTASYNISMAEIYSQNQITSENNNIGHRRYKSVGAGSHFANGFQFSQTTNGSVSPSSSKQLVRFRSHRIFSCITGV
ncbi:uncharacterized protein [Cicer arietinum]|uniref:Uncharacterized protein LOC101488652 n=1 Tax=Cicer arietinum TaxID=3827 RepID=A0A1S2YD08_CICAR|nr:uncharacterized protein LOC101488652 [Cicer arietinum]